MENSRQRIEQEWRRLTEEFEPQIREARAEVEALEAEFADVRERRDAAVDRHGKIVAAYNDAWEIVSKTGGKG